MCGRQRHRVSTSATADLAQKQVEARGKNSRQGAAPPARTVCRRAIRFDGKNGNGGQQAGSPTRAAVVVQNPASTHNKKGKNCRHVCTNTTLFAPEGEAEPRPDYHGGGEARRIDAEAGECLCDESLRRPNKCCHAGSPFSALRHSRLDENASRIAGGISRWHRPVRFGQSKPPRRALVRAASLA